MKKILAFVLAAMLLMFTFVSCGNTPAATTAAATDAATTAGNGTEAPATDAPAPEAGGEIAAVKAAGKLVVGITEFAPMDYQDADGNWIGFDADMAKKFAESLGVAAEFTIIDWDNKVLELNGKTVDCIWNGMTLTDEVKSAMDCSVAYCNNAQVIIVPIDKAADYATAEACKDLNFAVEAGSAGKEQAEANNFKFTEVADQATALMEVASGTCDAAIIDSLMAAAMVGEGTGYANLTYTAGLNSEEYGVGFRKGSDLVAAFNDFFAAAVADGTAEAIATTYGVQAALIK